MEEGLSSLVSPTYFPAVTGHVLFGVAHLCSTVTVIRSAVTPKCAKITVIFSAIASPAPLPHPHAQGSPSRHSGIVRYVSLWVPNTASYFDPRPLEISARFPGVKSFRTVLSLGADEGVDIEESRGSPSKS